MARLSFQGQAQDDLQDQGLNWLKLPEADQSGLENLLVTSPWTFLTVTSF